MRAEPPRLRELDARSDRASAESGSDDSHSPVPSAARDLRRRMVPLDGGPPARAGGEPRGDGTPRPRRGSLRRRRRTRRHSRGRLARSRRRSGRLAGHHAALRGEGGAAPRRTRLGDRRNAGSGTVRQPAPRPRDRNASSFDASSRSRRGPQLLARRGVGRHVERENRRARRVPRPRAEAALHRLARVLGAFRRDRRGSERWTQPREQPDRARLLPRPLDPRPLDGAGGLPRAASAASGRRLAVGRGGLRLEPGRNRDPDP